MKKHCFYLLGFMAFGAMSLASCSSDEEYDDTETIMVSDAEFAYDSDGVWTENSKPGFINIDDYEFSHYIEDTYGTVYGFTPSKVTDTSLHDPFYTFPYACAAGGGVSGAGSQYLVGYWTEYLETEDTEFNDRSCRIYAEDGDTFKPVSVMVCNNTYLMYDGLNGSNFTPAFSAGDWVTLNAYGVHLDGTTSQAVFYLVNIESTDVKSGILTHWKKFDLSALGACTGIYFTMDCSESLKNANGMAIPSYFCIDKLVVKE